MTLLYLVRHGETDWNRARRIQGSTDIPLNDTGRAQAGRTGRLLAGREWHAIATSPLERALETAQIISAEVGVEDIELVPALQERAYGAAEGLDDTELARLFPGDSFVPGREPRADVATRAIAALIGLALRHPDRNVIVTTHGGVIRSVVNAVAPDDASHHQVPITNGSVHSFRYVEGALKLVEFNDPIELESVREDCGELEEQNSIERREHVS
jgi:uncharacterized phosphatase